MKVSSWLRPCSLFECSMFGCWFVFPHCLQLFLFVHAFLDVNVEMSGSLLREPSPVLLLELLELLAGAPGAPSVRELLRPLDGAAEPRPLPPSSPGSGRGSVRGLGI